MKIITKPLWLYFIAIRLSNKAQQNSKKLNNNEKILLHMDDVPTTLLTQYIMSIYHNIDIDNMCYIFMDIYIERLLNNSKYTLTNYNCYYITSICLSLAIKYINCVDYDISEFYDVCLISKENILELELEFMKILDYKLYVSTDEVNTHLEKYDIKLNEIEY